MDPMTMMAILGLAKGAMGALSPGAQQPMKTPQAPALAPINPGLAPGLGALLEPTIKPPGFGGY